MSTNDQKVPSYVFPMAVYEKHPVTFAMMVGSHEMEPTLPQGWIALVDPQCQAVNDGDYAVSVVQFMDRPNGYWCCARTLVLPDSVVVTFDNHDGDVILRKSDLQIIGSVVWVQPPCDDRDGTKGSWVE